MFVRYVLTNPSGDQPLRQGAVDVQRDHVPRVGDEVMIPEIRGRYTSRGPIAVTGKLPEEPSGRPFYRYHVDGVLWGPWLPDDGDAHKVSHYGADGKLNESIVVAEIRCSAR